MKKLLLVLLLTVPAWAISLRSGQVSVGTTATLVGDATDRITLILTNDGTADIFCGPSTVTTSTGKRVAPQASLTLSDTPSAWSALPSAAVPLYCVTATGTVSVSFLEIVR
jgi:hypothetical protein